MIGHSDVAVIRNEILPNSGFPGVPLDSELNLELVAELSKALDVNEITPFLQPILNLATGELSGFEVLARWQHPRLGFLSASDFIPLADRAGLIGRLTNQLLVQAATAAAGWPPHLNLAINVSPSQLRDHTLPRELSAAAARAGIPMDRLVFEITESALIDNLDGAFGIARELKAFGVGLALDDFGTGYSSLMHLQVFPFDRIKIDASFVRTMAEQSQSRKIVESLVGLGQSLGLITMAEGVETEAQAKFLTILGCDLGQGWLLGRPVAIEDAALGLADGRWTRPAAARASPLAADLTLFQKAPPSQRLAQLQAIYDGAPVGLAYFDRDMRYISVNRRLAEMQGVPMSDYAGRRVQDVLPDINIAIEPYLHNALAGQPTTDLEVHRSPIHHRGANHFLVSYLPVRDENGEVLGVTAAIIDISERKRHEEAMQRAEKFSLIGQLAGGIAHDFNNLLTVIMHNLESVADDTLESDPRHGLVTTALAAAETGAKLISRLLSLSRRQPLRPRRVEINRFLSSFKLLAGSMLGESCTIEVRSAARVDVRSVTIPRIVRTDLAQLESALLNLVVNARDAMSKGGPVVLTTEIIEIDQHQAVAYENIQPGDYIAIVVTDAGEGMSNAVLARATEPFFSTKAPGVGTGLGLSMVYGFAKQTGGHVTFESELGRGTSVRLYLPLDNSGAAAEDVELRSEAEWLPGTIRTLIVEDQPDVAMVVARLCRNLGLEVTVVGTAEAALDLISADGGFDLLFTDIVLPGSLNGFQLAEQALRHIPGLKILYSSGYTDTAESPPTIALRTEVLIKPYRRSQLVSVLRQLFKPVAGEGNG